MYLFIFNQKKVCFVTESITLESKLGNLFLWADFQEMTISPSRKKYKVNDYFSYFRAQHLH